MEKPKRSGELVVLVSRQVYLSRTLTDVRYAARFIVRGLSYKGNFPCPRALCGSFFIVGQQQDRFTDIDSHHVLSAALEWMTRPEELAKLAQLSPLHRRRGKNRCNCNMQDSAVAKLHEHARAQDSMRSLDVGQWTPWRVFVYASLLVSSALSRVHRTGRRLADRYKRWPNSISCCIPNGAERTSVALQLWSAEARSTLPLKLLGLIIRVVGPARFYEYSATADFSTVLLPLSIDLLINLLEPNPEPNPGSLKDCASFFKMLCLFPPPHFNRFFRERPEQNVAHGGQRSEPLQVRLLRALLRKTPTAELRPLWIFAVTILCRFMEMEATYHGLCATVKYQFPEGLQWSLVVARKRLLKSEICFNKGCTERDTEASDPFQMCKQCRRCVIAFALRIRDTHTPASG